MDNFLDEFSNVFLQLKNKNDIQSFLKEILTENEISDLRLRWELLKMLKAGRSQRSIAKELKISLCKITRGAKILKQSDSMVNTILS
ncbi:MAG: hypothetical protein A2015_05035 [Spirochaetes bacterium GWF1_31_7]|nr:MAG: hypothetical protein A2Y30_16425 [Spirochaetes bacterium GWE1_32_154]OHD48560.1 MAG: hypothetical protein A2Y29_14400 [Spirochaetes bacterium GWE2_31_10]OHD50427.1 MAG: hypothetical protein A2015_05035 [Spirochaetes bacterium GWF1_31_7]OHD78446.1 MAG: hypothetical protein A2355_09210 [Spirochaetes bacterium RIFOXYB1_FULL_32_8]HBD93304.1 transcriptional regulator [Spirochaetia bacterium]